jgi:hypothetical protein
MRRPALPLAVALVLVGGCSDPSNDLLTPGQMVVVTDKNGTTLHHADVRAIFPNLKPGVTARVGSDPGYRETPDEMTLPEDAKREPERITPPNVLAKYRKVKVTVESGQYQGASGEVYRNDVRPIP